MELFDEKSSLAKFTELFGPKLWNNTVVVVTQANALKADLEKEKEVNQALDIEEAFQERISEWRDKVRKRVEKVECIRKKKIKKLPILPAGYSRLP